jgi:ATP-binding cassette subfamily F protein 3
VQEEFEKLGAREAETRSMLGRFGFAPDELGKHIAALSGGELNRLQIARAVYLKANLLILDEPTNHLDIASREAVEEGLSDFDGTMLVVSHDRWFLERIVERILYIEDLTIKVYEGSFSEFWRDTQGVSLLERPVKTASMESRSRGVAESVGGKARAKDTVGANARDMEARILELERGKGELERRISRAVTERKFAEGSKLSAELEKTNTLIERLYKEWN